MVKGKDIIQKEHSFLVKRLLEHQNNLNLNIKKNEFTNGFEAKTCNCKRCGHRFNMGNKYCGNCGLKRAL